MTDSDCIFCRIACGQIPSARIFENDHVVSFMDIAPISPGHCLIIPKEHFTRLEECPPSLLAQLTAPVGPIAKAVINAVGAEDFNFLNNNGRSAGQVVDHVHFHIIPRKPDDGVFNRWPAGQYPLGQMEQLAQKISRQLQNIS